MELRNNKEDDRHLLLYSCLYTIHTWPHKHCTFMSRRSHSCMSMPWLIRSSQIALLRVSALRSVTWLVPIAHSCNSTVKIAGKDSKLFCLWYVFCFIYQYRKETSLFYLINDGLSYSFHHNTCHFSRLVKNRLLFISPVSFGFDVLSLYTLLKSTVCTIGTHSGLFVYWNKRDLW